MKVYQNLSPIMTKSKFTAKEKERYSTILYLAYVIRNLFLILYYSESKEI
jgi:hypothetical protein